MHSVRVHDKNFELYLPESQILARVQAMAEQINADYQGEDVLLLPILNGAYIFAADLIRSLEFQPSLQFVKISTYGDSMTSSRQVRDSFGLNKLKVKDRHVLIIEDIIDTGFTSGYLRAYLTQQAPASVKVATCLYKPDAFKGKTKPEYVGFEIPDFFVIGYGLDYAQKGRELRGIYKPEEKNE